MLTSSARIRRGFSRLGVAFASMFVIVAVICGAVAGGDGWQRIGRGYEQAQCVAAYEKRHVWAGTPIAPSPPRSGMFDDLIPQQRVAPPPPPGYEFVAARVGCPGPSYSLSFEDAGRLVSEGPVTPYLKAAAWTVVGVVAIAVTAFCIWLAFYGIGWTLAGFARD
jgi:hypothetical protein